jgi:hypothetical protein
MLEAEKMYTVLMQENKMFSFKILTHRLANNIMMIYLF